MRKAKKYSPHAKIVVAGCYAQMSPDELRKIEGIDYILGTSEKYKVFDYLEEDLETVVKIDKSPVFTPASTSSPKEQTRAFLKIQDGCNYICSFCIIPFARGRSRTISVDDAVNQAQRLVNRGFREIVLTGVNIGEFESTSGQKLLDLLKKLNEIESLERIRLSSVEPNTFTNDMIDFMANSEKFMNHFHIPLQSGDDSILRLMKRKYNLNYYENLIQKLRKSFKNATFGADVMVGHPGEADENFQNTYDFIKKVNLTHLHVFPYSRRKNTVSDKMENQVLHQVKKERVHTLIKLGEELKSDLIKQSHGQKTKVLVEKNKEGHTENFLKASVMAESNEIVEGILEFDGKNLKLNPL